MWQHRNLSLNRMITVINSLSVSLLVYPCDASDTPENRIKVTKSLFCEFLRNGKVNKIEIN